MDEIVGYIKAYKSKAIFIKYLCKNRFILRILEVRQEKKINAVAEPSRYTVKTMYQVQNDENISVK